MKQLLRVNDIVIYCIHYYNGHPANIYGKIDRIVLDNHQYNQLIVTTGEGDNNTKCLIDITYICETETLQPREGSCSNINPHKINKVNFSNAIQSCLHTIELNKKRIDFFKEHENPSRGKIIDEVLSEVESS